MTCPLYTSQSVCAWCEEAYLPTSTHDTSVCRYAENQDLVNTNSNVMKEQADVIAVLEERLSKQPGPVTNRSLKNDKKQIKELESDVESLKVFIAMLSCAVLCCAVLCCAVLQRPVCVYSISLIGCSFEQPMSQLEPLPRELSQRVPLVQACEASLTKA